MMKIRHYILLIPLLVLMALLMAACSSDSDVATDDTKPLPEGMGRIRITICTPEANPDLTRAVGSPAWENPDHEWERLQTFRILICNASDNKVVKIISGDKSQVSAVSGTSYPYKQSADITTEITAGTYIIYATANYADGYGVGSTVNTDATEKFYNGYSATGTTLFGNENPIPMTGKLTTVDGGSTMKTVTVSAGSTTDAGTITVWRVMSKLQFEFTNEALEQIQIMGIEVDPINQINTGDDAGKGLVYLFSKDDLTSEANLAANGGVTLPSGVTTGAVSYEISSETPLLTLAAKNDANTDDEGTCFFYVNESNATFTTTQNQYSLRFKIKRGGTIEELRYGVTTHYGNGTTGQNGFNVIRRNDWIHIPIVLTDWQLRIEPLAFVPIAGYPATTVSSDGLTATFGTGGMIALQPFIKKKNHTTWRDFGDSEITLVSIHWKNSDGEDKAVYNSDGTAKDGVGKIVKTAFAYDDVTKCIIGELNNDLTGGPYKTTFTINVELGTSPLYQYSFTFNVILQ